MDKEMQYEEAIKEIEEIIQKLEVGNLPLKTSTEMFEKASVLAKYAQAELTKTTGKLYQIKKELDEIKEEEV